MFKALKISIQGRVQGVGFRPFVFQLADQYKLTGTVQNNMDGVKIHIEGDLDKLEQFIDDIKTQSPRLSKINKIEVAEANVEHYDTFSIIESDRNGTSLLVIPIDSAVCDECLEEMNDPNNFRYRYPFINCTQCGPRYTIIKDLPYDRPFTTMANFAMCPQCLQEYNNPLNRRHHAQPIACPTCGPQVQLVNQRGEFVQTEDPIVEVAKLLKDGHIVAIKGIGGYHLSCDATNERAVQLLRERKRRPNRPLAVMTATIQEASRFAELTEDEKQLLQSPEAPIVVVQKSSTFHLANGVAPGMNTIGMMLPYTPLHHLLFQCKEISTLVMTSANPSGQPILYKDEEAFSYLSDIADYFLIHNREILHPVDDSVIQCINGHEHFFRRARGYVPDPFFTNQDVTGIIAFGGQQKSTFTIGRNEQIFVGPHIGDLENIETINHFKRELNHLLTWVDVPFQTAVIDAHPGYEAKGIVSEYPFKDIMKVQHHHAHMAACLEENKIDDDAFGIILDGTGYGLDGHIWGFEIFYGNKSKFERQAHLMYTPLPGAEKSIREPWRNAVAMLIALLGEQGEQLATKLFPDKEQQIQVLKAMIKNNLNTVNAGTCGRLFDAVSAMIGVCTTATYDGEAAILLSELADSSKKLEPYPFTIVESEGILTFDFSKMLSEIVEDAIQSVEQQWISTRFHETIVVAIVTAMKKITCADHSKTNKVVFSGGSFHNRYLHERLHSELSKIGFSVYTHRQVPCNDGGLSFGQLVVAAAKRGTSECV